MINVDKNSNGYFIKYDRMVLDANVALELNMTLDEYAEILILQFGAKIIVNGLYFDEPEAVDKAAEWVRAKLTMNKLIER